MYFYIKSVCYLVAAFCLVSTKSATKYSIEVDNAVKLIIGVRPIFRFNCVHVVTSEFQEHRMSTRLTKALSVLGFPCTSMDIAHLGLLHGRSFCSTPLKVLLPETLSAPGRLRQLSRNVRFSQSKWILFLLDMKKTDELFKDVDVPFDCEMVIATTLPPGLVLTEVYRVAAYFPLRRVMLGWWTPKTGFKIFSNETHYNRRNNLQGIHMTAAVIENPPVNILEKQNDTIILKGYFGKLWKILQDRLNMTNTYVVPLEGKWGNPTDYGWDGMVGMVLRGEANLSACGITMLSSRIKAVDFTLPLYTSQFRIFIRKAVNRGFVGANDYLTPFSKNLWLAMLVTTFTAAALVVLRDRVMQRVVSDDEERYTLVDAIFFVFGAIFCQQVPPTSDRRLSWRLIQVTVYMVTVIAISSYSGTLISSLTVYTPRLPFDDLKGLNKSKYSLGMANSSVALTTFRGAKTKLLKDLYRKHLTTGKNLVKSIDMAFIRVCKEDFTYIAAQEALSPDSTICEVTYLPDYFMKGPLGLAFPRDSPYRGVVNHVLLQMMENGLLSYLRKITWPSKVSVAVTPLKSIDYTDIRPLMNLMLAGLVLSVAVLTLERCRAAGLRDTAGTRRPRVVRVQPRWPGVPADRRIEFE